MCVRLLPVNDWSLGGRGYARGSELSEGKTQLKGAPPILSSTGSLTFEKAANHYHSVVARPGANACYSVARGQSGPQFFAEELVRAASPLKPTTP